MSEKQSIHPGIGNVPDDLRELAKVFDKLSQERDPLHMDHVITWHHERPESFRWFIAGVMYQRRCQQGTK